MADTETEVLPDSPAGVIDVEELRDLFKLLTEFRVSTFQMGPLAVSFHEPEAFSGFTQTKARTEDDGHSTSSKRVDGFNGPAARHPALWPNQNGKSLNLKGELE